MWTVVEQPSVATAVDQALQKWSRAQDAWDAVTWVLARDPEFGTALTESGKTRSLTLEGARAIGLPNVTVVYELRNGQVIVHDVQFGEGTYARAGRA